MDWDEVVRATVRDLPWQSLLESPIETELLTFLVTLEAPAAKVKEPPLKVMAGVVHPAAEVLGLRVTVMGNGLGLLAVTARVPTVAPGNSSPPRVPAVIVGAAIVEAAADPEPVPEVLQ